MAAAINNIFLLIEINLIGAQFYCSYYMYKFLLFPINQINILAKYLFNT